MDLLVSLAVIEVQGSNPCGGSLLALALACETSCVLGFIHLRMDTAAQSETLVSLVRAYSASCTSLTTGKGIRVFER